MSSVTVVEVPGRLMVNSPLAPASTASAVLVTESSRLAGTLSLSIILPVALLAAGSRVKVKLAEEALMSVTTTVSVPSIIWSSTVVLAMAPCPDVVNTPPKWNGVMPL
ncbi:hypothetical protein D3C86_1633030 [compost metagenome]